MQPGAFGFTLQSAVTWPAPPTFEPVLPLLEEEPDLLEVELDEDVSFTETTAPVGDKACQIPPTPCPFACPAFASPAYR